MNRFNLEIAPRGYLFYFQNDYIFYFFIHKFPYLYCQVHKCCDIMIKTLLKDSEHIYEINYGDKSL